MMTLAFIGALSQTQVLILVSIYLVLLISTLYIVLKEDLDWRLRIAKMFLIIVVPLIGVVIVWLMRLLNSTPKTSAK